MNTSHGSKRTGKSSKPVAPRYLTKSRFKLGMECPTKLFYTRKEAEYANENLEDSFLAALAEGGFQVGELAKQYFPGGTEIETLDYEEALAQTNELLRQKNVVIYEAAIRFGNLFIRADLLVKKGDVIDLIEVKAKSFDSTFDSGEESPFMGRKDGIKSAWKPYLYDVAFQKHVIVGAFPQFKVRASLMLADKAAQCPSDGLHQKFRVAKGSNAAGRLNRQHVVVKPLTAVEQKNRILCQVEVDRECDVIFATKLAVEQGPTGFIERIGWLADHYERDAKILSRPAPVCGGCEFKATPEEEAKGLKSGFKECWKAALKWKDRDFEAPSVLDIWNYRGKARLMDEGRIAIGEVTQEDISPEGDDKAGISASDRRWLQVEKAQKKDDTIWIDREALRREMAKWKFPLHFIDFETTRVAIPFNQGRHPYELVAFQFSHHIMQEDGRIEHRGQYLNTEPGYFPNYDFVRALKRELEDDQGSIFRYATHENSTLVAIDRQMAEDPAPPKDRAALSEFIRSITVSSGDAANPWKGDRSMIDLCEMVKRFYYAPSTNGSNSIKQVLPAVLNSSAFLQGKFSKPLYGAKDGILSRNFADQRWIKVEDGRVVDPYKLLPKLFTDVSDHDLKRLNDDDELKDGGAAMTAYARMQFEEMDQKERDQLQAALLRYCELDTFAMVLIYEAWREEVG